MHVNALGGCGWYPEMVRRRDELCCDRIVAMSSHFQRCGGQYALIVTVAVVFQVVDSTVLPEEVRFSVRISTWAWASRHASRLTVAQKTAFSCCLIVVSLLCLCDAVGRLFRLGLHRYRQTDTTALNRAVSPKTRVARCTSSF